MIYKPTEKIINKLPIVRRVTMSKKRAVPSRLTSISMPMNRPKIMKNNIPFNSSGTLKNRYKLQNNNIIIIKIHDPRYVLHNTYIYKIIHVSWSFNNHIFSHTTLDT